MLTMSACGLRCFAQIVPRVLKVLFLVFQQQRSLLLCPISVFFYSILSLAERS